MRKVSGIGPEVCATSERRFHVQRLFGYRRFAEGKVGAMQRPSGESKRVTCPCQKRNFLAVESFSVLTRTFNG